VAKRKTNSISDSDGKTPKRKPKRQTAGKPEVPVSQAAASDIVSVHGANEAPENNSQEQPSSQTPPDSGSADPVSIDSPESSQDTKTDAGSNKRKPSTPPTGKQANEQDTGVPFALAKSATECDGSTLTDGPIAHARHGETRGMCWERLRKEARAAGMARGQGPGTAYEWATRETDRLFPAPLPPEPEPVEIPEEPSAIEPEEPIPELIPEPETSPAADKPAADSLVFVVPESWGELPDNATLQAEIAWVSANRLRVRDGSWVDLSRAKTPAPSYSALSWLETSILFPSKFADISVKATANQDDEREAIRREKASIEEVRAILKEMLEG
jgi:hypothetical protein